MIWEIFYKFRKIEKEQAKPSENYKIKLVLLIVVAVAIATFAIIINNPIIYAILYGIIAFTIIIVFIIQSNNLVTGRNKGIFNSYRQEINLLKDILNEMNIDSGPQIKYLIGILSESKDKYRISDKLFKPIFACLSTIVIPIIIQSFQWFFDYTKVLTDAYVFIGLFIVIILNLVGLYYVLYPVVKNLLDKIYRDLDNIECMCKDIYLIYYLNDNQE